MTDWPIDLSTGCFYQRSIFDILQPVRDAAVQELSLACEAAAMLGCAQVVLHPGPEREGRSPEVEFLQHMHHAAESLNLVAARCCELGVQLLLENMLAHLLFGHVRDMMYLLGEISTCLDTGHAHLARELGLGHSGSVPQSIPWHPRAHGTLVLELQGSGNEAVEIVLARALPARKFLEKVCTDSLH